MFEATTGERDGSKPPTAIKPIGVLAGIGGFLIARYTSHFIYVPLAATLLIAFACKRWLPETRQRGAAAVAVQAGYIVWLVVGVAVTKSPAGLIDIVALSAVLAWFALTLSRASAVSVAVLHLGLLAVNVWQYASAPAASMEQRALVVHVLFRVLAAGLALRTIWPSQPPVATSQSQDPASPVYAGSPNPSLQRTPPE